MTPDLDVEIAAILHRHHTRQTLGWYYYETNPHPTGPGHATRPPHNKDRAGKPVRTSQRPHTPTRITRIELDTLQLLSLFALAGCDIRGIT